MKCCKEAVVTQLKFHNAFTSVQGGSREKYLSGYPMFRPRFEYSTSRIKALPPDQPECSASQPNPFIPGDKNSGNNRADGCIVPKVGLDAEEMRKTSLRPPVIGLRLPGRPIHGLIIILTDGSYSKVCDTIITLCR